MNDQAENALYAPLSDIWIAALSRHAPNLGCIGRLSELVSERRIVMLPGMRQRVLSAVVEDRQAQRLDWCLRGFGLVHAVLGDEDSAAQRQRQWRRRGLDVSMTQALWWTVADRLSLKIWTNEKSWQVLKRRGAPVVSFQ
jgi:hypothetical protein